MEIETDMVLIDQRVPAVNTDDFYAGPIVQNSPGSTSLLTVLLAYPAGRL